MKIGTMNILCASSYNPTSIEHYPKQCDSAFEKYETAEDKYNEAYWTWETFKDRCYSALNNWEGAKNYK